MKTKHRGLGGHVFSPPLTPLPEHRASCSKEGPRSVSHGFSLGKWARAGKGLPRAPPLGGGRADWTPRL